jgi:putative peptidoglycan lipid II flippase
MRPAAPASISVATVLAANVLLALAGVVRDALLAAYLGLSTAADAFTLAWFVIDLAASALLGSIAATVAIAHLAGEGRRPADTQSFLGAVLAVGAAAGAALALVSPWLIHGLDPTLHGAGADAAILALRWLAPLLVTIPLLTAMSAALQLRRQFTAAALAPIVMTVWMTVGALAYGPGLHIVALARFTALGGIITLIWPALAAARHGIPLRPRLPTAPGWRCLRAASGAVSLWYVLIQIGQAVDRSFAGRLGPGAVAALSYAVRFEQAPVWIFAAAVTTVAYPAMARLRARGAAGSVQLVGAALGLIALGAVPLALILGMFAAPIIGLVLGRGALTPADVSRIAAAVAAYAPGMVFAAANALLFRALFAAGRQHAAARAAAIALAAQAVADGLLAPRFGLAGIGAAGAIGQLAALAANLMYLGREYGAGVQPLRVWLRDVSRGLWPSLSGLGVWLAGAAQARRAGWSGLDWLVAVAVGLAAEAALVAIIRNWAWRPLWRTLRELEGGGGLAR